MTRAYIRLDPAFDERKEAYPDGPYAALVAVFCAAEQQPQRGRFRSEKYLRALLGKRGRHVPFLIQKGDLTVMSDGRLYVDGWDEWQEGDWKVGERVSRIRNRPRNGTCNGRCNAPRNGDVTVPTVQGERLDLLERSAGAGADKALTTERAPAVVEKPFVALSDEEKAERIRKDKEELMAKTMQRLGVRP